MKKVKDSDKVLIEELGKRISFYRKEKGLTQSHLSDLAVMEKSDVSRIELGKTNPTFKTLMCILKDLEIPLKELVDT